jgi:hypothetical protein
VGQIPWATASTMRVARFARNDAWSALPGRLVCTASRCSRNASLIREGSATPSLIASEIRLPMFDSSVDCWAFLPAWSFTTASASSTARRNLSRSTSHQPTRQRERAMKRFKSIRHAQRFLSAFSGISPHFRPRRHLLSAADYRQVMAYRFAVWNEITGATTTAAA